MESPLRPPPPGFASNFDNPEFLGTPVVVTAGVCLPLIFLFAFARIFARVLTKKWTFQDYIFCCTSVLGVALIAFSIPLTLAKPYGYHVWDIDGNEITKSSMLRLQTFSISLGPVLWLSKVTIFGFMIHIFGSTRWFKNSAYIGIIATGLLFSLYTCTVTMACAPRPGSDVQSYINGFRRDACSSSHGINMVVGVIMGFANGLTDLYLVTAAWVLNSTLNVTAKEMRFVYLVHLSGAIACVCGFLGVVYRIKSYEDADITGYQIPLNVAIIIELTLSLMIPCMPSFFTIYRHYTYVEINEKTTIGSPTSRLTSTLSYYQNSSPTPPPEPRPTWRKTHLSVEELPFRKASSEFNGEHAFSPRDSRMKALPCTPLPFHAAMVPTSPTSPTSLRSPLSPMTPGSVRSMQLPIVLEHPHF